MFMNDNICYHMVTKINKFYSILTNADDKCKQMLFNVILTNLINFSHYYQSQIPTKVNKC